MTIKGLSRYDICEHQGKIQIRNKKRGSLVKLTNSDHTSPRYTMRVDSETPVYKSFSPGFIRFLIKNPEIDAQAISPAEDNVRFTEDGRVIDLHGSSGRKKPYNSFQDVDEALTTVIIMKAASKGDLEFVYKFIMENREKAIKKVSHLEDVPIDIIRLHSAAGEEHFIYQLRTASCQKIIPLFAWLCKCIRISFLEHKRNFIQISKLHAI